MDQFEEFCVGEQCQHKCTLSSHLHNQCTATPLKKEEEGGGGGGIQTSLSPATRFQLFVSKIHCRYILRQDPDTSNILIGFPALMNMSRISCFLVLICAAFTRAQIDYNNCQEM